LELEYQNLLSTLLSNSIEILQHGRRAAAVLGGGGPGGGGGDDVVGWCRLTVLKPVLKVPMVSALEAMI
jgi:hypothetical protein